MDDDEDTTTRADEDTTTRADEDTTTRADEDTTTRADEDTTTRADEDTTTRADEDTTTRADEDTTTWADDDDESTTAWDDEAWDRHADAELDALAASEELRPGPRPPWEPPFRWPPPARVYDRQLAVLTVDGVGEFLRACRASAGLSQREVAEAAGVPQSTVARLESGRSADVKLSTVVRLAEQCEVILVGTAGSHAPMLETDLAQRHLDRSGRLLPAHLFNAPYVSTTLGDARRGSRGIPERSYGRRRLKDVPDD